MEDSTPNGKCLSDVESCKVMLCINDDTPESSHIPSTSPPTPPTSQRRSRLCPVVTDSSTEQGNSNCINNNNNLLPPPPRPRRSSSMKLPRNPLDSGAGATSKEVVPTKGVRFADAIGLELTRVVQIVNPDCPPIIPDYVKQDLHLNDTSDTEEDRSPSYFMVPRVADYSSPSESPSSTDTVFGRRPTFIPTFTQPNESTLFRQCLWAQNVCLATAYFDPVQERIQGIIQVKNICFHKHVFIRGTYNSWRTQNDYVATFSSSLPPQQPWEECGTDQFTFSVYLPAALGIESFQFCVGFKTDTGMEFWDNNADCNYTFQAVSATGALLR